MRQYSFWVLVNFLSCTISEDFTTATSMEIAPPLQVPRTDLLSSHNPIGLSQIYCRNMSL